MFAVRVSGWFQHQQFQTGEYRSVILFLEQPPRDVQAALRLVESIWAQYPLKGYGSKLTSHAVMEVYEIRERTGFSIPRTLQEDLAQPAEVRKPATADVSEF